MGVSVDYDKALPRAVSPDAIAAVASSGRFFDVTTAPYLADNSGVGDSTTAIQAAIDAAAAAGGGVVWLPLGAYRTTANLQLKTKVRLSGSAARIFCSASWATYGAFVEANGITDFAVSGITFDAGGSYSGSAFANPYSAGNSVGFSNNHVGVWIRGSAARGAVTGNTFTGIARGVLIASATALDIDANQFTTLGACGIYVEAAQYVTVRGNIIRSVAGNLTSAGDTSTASSKYADGINIHGSTDISIVGNVIEDVKRIGIVLEGDGVTLNARITISGNVVKNCNGNRGSERNAGIWSESGKSTRPINVIGNTVDNTGAAAGTNNQRGIVGYHCAISSNVVTGWRHEGVFGADMSVTGNEILGNGYDGVQVYAQAAGKTTRISGNYISGNGSSGVRLEVAHGIVVVDNNTIDGNGVTRDFSGVMVNRYYNDQRVVIKGNAFLSAAAEAASTGQLYGIRAVYGGDINWTSRFIEGNTFAFTGTFSTAYPGNIVVVPCSLGIDNTSTVTVSEIHGLNANESDKVAQNYRNEPNVWRNEAAGVQRFVGWASSAPSTGSAKQGDYVLNNSVAAAGYMGYVCTTTGSPGTWKGFGAIQA